MCGIVGFITAERKVDSWDRRKFIEQALIIDTLRGSDGAGVFAARHQTNNDNPENLTAGYAKVQNTGYTLIHNQGFIDLFKDGMEEFKYVVGHNRAATRGGISIEATHPFQEGPITMVHNGTLDSTYGLGLTQYAASAVNDSHTICHNLAKFDAEEVLSKLDGAYTLVWHDSRDDTLNFIRNTKRPLFMAKVSKRDTIYFASEGEMLYWLDARIGLGMQGIVSLAPMNWLKFKPGNMIPEVKKIEYKPTSFRSNVPATTGGGTHYTPHQSQYAGTPSSRTVGARELGGFVLTSKKDRDIPEIMANMLYDEVGTTISEIRNFTPVEWFPTTTVKGQTVGMVTGYIEDSPGLPYGCSAMAIGVPNAGWNAYKNHVWSVRPVGFRWLDNEIPCVICRVVTHCTSSGNTRIVPEDQKGKFPSQWRGEWNRCLAGDEDDLAREIDAYTFMYPAGEKYLTKSAWYQSTQEGCSQCNCNLFIEDAEKMSWVGDQKDQPLCPDCSKLWDRGN